METTGDKIPPAWFYAFFLMMAIMTYNGFLCTAIIVGAVTGLRILCIWTLQADKRTRVID
ncbi:hypothetical protein ROZALSC1DRAFT_10734 [Rozella allomycis CSF55]|uniref:Copper transport protein n=1 Tax=Rozella allomycis (strain CSF55) TaxID=988480 RepID=A0A4V1J0L4_ROZAC|nr:hypothetical protein ROZALSC1DRAFT_10734 [Rozella allomycis CSF55]